MFTETRTLCCRCECRKSLNVVSLSSEHFDTSIEVGKLSTSNFPYIRVNSTAFSTLTQFLSQLNRFSLIFSQSASARHGTLGCFSFFLAFSLFSLLSFSMSGFFCVVSVSLSSFHLNLSYLSVTLQRFDNVYSKDSSIVRFLSILVFVFFILWNRDVSRDRERAHGLEPGRENKSKTKQKIKIKQV